MITLAELQFVHSQQTYITYHLLSIPINFNFKRSSIGGDGGGWEALSKWVGGVIQVGDLHQKNRLFFRLQQVSLIRLLANLKI
jgi:hypothetical protein